MAKEWIDYNSTSYKKGMAIRIKTWSAICEIAKQMNADVVSYTSYKGSKFSLSDVKSLRPNGTSKVLANNASSVVVADVNGYSRFEIPAELCEMYAEPVRVPRKQSIDELNYKSNMWQRIPQDGMIAAFDRVRILTRTELNSQYGFELHGNISNFSKIGITLGANEVVPGCIRANEHKKMRAGEKVFTHQIDYINKRVKLSSTHQVTYWVPFELLEVELDLKTSLTKRKNIIKSVEDLRKTEEAKTKTTEENTTLTQKESAMITPNFNTQQIMDQNKDALLLAAKIEVGEAAVKQVSKIIKKQLPLMVKGYAELPIFDVLVANLVVLAIRQYAPKNEKAQIIADAMLIAAMQKQMKEFNIPKMIDDFVSNVDTSSLTAITSKSDD